MFGFGEIKEDPPGWLMQPLASRDLTAAPLNLIQQQKNVHF